MATQDKKTDVTASQFSEQALALAEQMGRIAGAMEGTAEQWMGQASLTDSLVRVRDGAASLLDRMVGGAARGRREATTGSTMSQPMPQPTPASRNRTAGKSRNTASAAAPKRSASADPAHAPGKRHRKPAPSARGAKHSNQSIPKMRSAAAARQRRKSYA